MKIGKLSLLGAWAFGAATYLLASPAGLQAALGDIQAAEGAIARWEMPAEQVLALMSAANSPESESHAPLESLPKRAKGSAKKGESYALASASRSLREKGGAAGDIQQRLGDRIAVAYRVSPWVAKAYAQEAFAVGNEVGVDPYLILAVMAIESSFNPVAQSSAGAVGLMQVIPRWHPETGASEINLTDDQKNIKAGAVALKKFLKMSSGNVEMALLKYNGSARDPSKKYAKKVMGRWMKFKAWAQDT